MLGCMHLTCTAIHSSRCLFCYMVSFRGLHEICFQLLGTSVTLAYWNFYWTYFLVAVIHYFLSPLLLAHGFIPVLLSNLLFMVAVSYYHYLNFLGYDGKTNIFCGLETFYLVELGQSMFVTAA